MDPLEAIFLGVVQGLTEFLPISSSGHLVLVPWLVDIRYLEHHPEFNRSFDVALHVGTLIAVVAYFSRDLVEMAAGAVRLARRRRVEDEAERLALAVVVGTLPAVVVGGLGEGLIERWLGQPWQIALLLAAFGLLLAYADRRPAREGMQSLTPRRALTIGAAQALALAPGVSRSGVTITAGRLLGLDRDSAARFSFLLLVPATAGAALIEGLDLARAGIPPGQNLALVLGIAASALSGYAAIWGLLRFVRTRSYDVFVVYRLLAAAIVLGLIVTGVRAATF